MTLKLRSKGFAGRAMRERNVVICNVVEKVELFFLQHEPGSDRVDGSIAPSLIEETTVLVQRLKIVDICLGAQPVQTTNFKVGPL